MRTEGPLTRLALFLPIMAATAAAVWLIGGSAYGVQMNAYVSDLFSRLRERPADSTQQIALVAIDDATLARFGNLPLDRRLVAMALLQVCRGRPAVVAIDIWFPEASNPEADQALSAALQACPQTVLASALVPDDRAAQQPARWLEPLPDFGKLAGSIGHVHADPDVDGVTRQVLLAKSAGGRRHWALSLEALRLYTRHEGPILEDEQTLVVGTHIIPAAKNNQRALLVNFPVGEGAFVRHSLLEVVDGRVLPEQFTGRAVFIGTTAQGAGDSWFTPVSSQGRPMPGVEIHANLLHTMMNDSFLRPLRESSALAAVALTAACVAVLLLSLRGAWLAVALALVAAAVHGAPFLLFVKRQVVAPAFSFSLAFWGPALVGGVFQYLTVWRRYVAADATSRRLRGRMEMVSHEMRSPLTAIQGSGEVISRYPVDEARRKQLGDMISRESQRLAGMVERFLDVERLEAGELQLRRAPVPLRGVVERTLERLQPLAARKEIVMEATINGQPQALGDSELIEFALYNLVSNAIKYSPEGSKVEVLARPNTLLGLAFLEVTDQGAGIATEDQARVFERFYRAEGARQSGQSGLGLGLSIVREIARHHGGSVMLDSVPGRGSKFSLSLPAAEAGASATAGH